MKFKRCLKFQGYFKDVTRMFQGSFKGVYRNFVGFLGKVKECFKEVSRVLKDISGKFQGYVKKVSRMFQVI